VAAVTLSQSDHDAIRATTVVGAVAAADVSHLERLVVEIADEFDLDASLKVRASSFAVRFAWRANESVL